MASGSAPAYTALIAQAVMLMQVLVQVHDLGTSVIVALKLRIAPHLFCKSLAFSLPPEHWHSSTLFSCFSSSKHDYTAYRELNLAQIATPMPRVYPPIEGRQTQSKLSPSIVESFAGFSAGIVSTLVVHPFDVIKTRLQRESETR